MQDWKDYFVSVCRENQLKVTPQRVVIYEILHNSKEHPSATDVYRIVKPKFPHMSFETVNRTLLTFNEIGLVNTVQVADKRKRFDADVTLHHHVYCNKCHRVADVPATDLAQLKLPEDVAREFTVLRASVTFEAVCRECSSAEAN